VAESASSVCSFSPNHMAKHTEKRVYCNWSTRWRSPQLGGERSQYNGKSVRGRKSGERMWLKKNSGLHGCTICVPTGTQQSVLIIRRRRQ
jgi:hypothetical protein